MAKCLQLNAFANYLQSLSPCPLGKPTYCWDLPADEVPLFCKIIYKWYGLRCCRCNGGPIFKIVLEVDRSNVVKLVKFGAIDLTNLFMNLEGKCSDVCLANPVTVCLCISHRVLAACWSQRQKHKYKDDYKIHKTVALCLQGVCLNWYSDRIFSISLVIFFGHLGLWSVDACAQFHTHNFTNTCTNG